jgi:predicted alpha-1,2-mannosidase
MAGCVAAMMAVSACDDGAASEPHDDAGVDAAMGPPPVAAEAPLVQYVDPFIGTGGVGFSIGSAFPGPQRPFGLARPGPDTATANGGAAPFYHCSGYYYESTHIRGFSQVRPHGMGIPEYGVIGVMPTLGMTEAKTHQNGRQEPFSHDTEVASPGYYAVTLDDSDIRVELTATLRVGLHRHTFPAGSDAVVIVDIGHFMANVPVVEGSLEVDPDTHEVFGYVRYAAGYSDRFGGMPVYFHGRFSRPFDSVGTWQDGVLSDEELTQEGPNAGAHFHFDTSTDQVVELAMGISFTDVERARLNLDAEMPTIDFEATRAEAEQDWEEHLARVELEGRDPDEFVRFYTALYHVLLMPTRADDADGSYRGFDGEVHTAEGFRYYTDFSLWDTFRTQHPALVLLYPEYQRDMLESLLTMTRQGGYMPRWPLGIGYTGGMIGESATIVFADSWVKGLREFDLREAYDAMRSTAMGPTPPGAPYGGRGGIEPYIELGYVPVEAASGSASRTLEYAYNDWALATLADALGETEDHAMFLERAGNWRNLYDDSSGFLVGRNEDGTFQPVFPTSWEDYYVEGNAYHYTWYVPQDLDGLADAMGGRDIMLERLEETFELAEAETPVAGLRNYYWHGNEPPIQYPFLFSAMDRPDASARWSRWVLRSEYGLGADGLPGNDDAGTLSAWFVFASLGVFPLAGTDHYLIGSPVFTRALLHLEGGDFEIVAPAAGPDTLYVGEATLGGEPLDRARVPHASIADGGRLELRMVPDPQGWAER